MSLIIYTILFAIICYIVFISIRNGRRIKNLPPGPPGIPIFGNIFEIDRRAPQLVFEKWAKKYGPVVSAYLASKLVVILNSTDVVKEALIKQGDNFAARPQLWAFDIFTEGKGQQGLINREGWAWKEQRRFALHVLRDFGFGRPLQEEKINDELRELYSSIDNKLKLNKLKKSQKSGDADVEIVLGLKFAVVNIITSMLMGRRFEQGDPDFLDFQKRIGANFVRIQRLLAMDFLPILKPFANLLGKNIAIQDARVVDNFVKKELSSHKMAVEEDPFLLEEPTDYMFAYLKEMKKRSLEKDQKFNSFTEDQCTNAILDLFVAGYETTATTLSWLMLYLVHNPKEQTRMRDEIEKAIGEAPNWEDRNKLPFVNAAITEAQRLANIAPLGVFHSVFEDAVVQGYKIPKGCIVIVNHWTIMRDPQLFKNPERFVPDRFLSPEGTFDNDRLEGVIPFSAGKRACLGESLARMELFKFASSIIYNYELLPPDTGLPTLEPVLGFTLAPQPFKLKIKKLLH